MVGMKIDQEFEVCEHCGASVRKENIENHLLKVHGVRSEADTGGKEGRHVGAEDYANIEGILLSEKTAHDYVQMRISEAKPQNDGEARKIVEESFSDMNKLTASLLSGAPTAGALARFFRSRREYIKEVYGKVHASMKDKGSLDDISRMADDFKDKSLPEHLPLEQGLLEIERLPVPETRSRSGVDRETAILERQFSLICRKKPGFEEYLTDVFFTKERCAKCTLAQLKEQGCVEGDTVCAYDEMYSRFQLEYVKKIVQEIKGGNSRPKGLEIPEQYAKLAGEMDKIREKAEGMG